MTVETRLHAMDTLTPDRRRGWALAARTTDFAARTAGLAARTTDAGSRRKVT